MKIIRKIIHVDMDAFYASVEQRDNPVYRGKPLVVGGEGRRGVISAASYEARKYGIYSAMSSVVARRKCPFLIFVYPRFDAYKKASQQIREIFCRYTDLVEPLSFDEAFLDVTENKINLPSATIIAKRIKKHIKEELNLTASAGVSYNKFLAKIASDYDKPDGFYLITPDDAQDFVEKLEVNKFFGVGKVTADKMHRMGIFTGADLKKREKVDLIKVFGKAGNFFYNIVRGIDDRPVMPDRMRKSIGAERTFEKDIRNLDVLFEKIEKTASVLYQRCEKADSYGRTLTLKVKFSDFKQITRSKSEPFKFNTLKKITDSARELYNLIDFSYNSVRLIGLSVTNLTDFEKGMPIQLRIPF